MRFKVSREARRDLLSIGRYTQERWGLAQRNKYLNDLDRAFGLLAENPGLGRACDDIRQGYCRFEHVSHIIFYKQQDDHILISRILHKSMDIKYRLG